MHGLSLVRKSSDLLHAQHGFTSLVVEGQVFDPTDWEDLYVSSVCQLMIARGTTSYLGSETPFHLCKLWTDLLSFGLE